MKSKRIFNRNTIILILTLFLIGSGMFSLIDKGFLSDTDEFPFVVVIEEFDDLIHLKTKNWIDLTLHADYPILEIGIKLIQTIFAKIYANINHLPLLSEDVLQIYGAFNILVSIGILFIFFKILKNLKFNFQLSILGVILLASLLNTNLYLRHLLSYDESLFFYLIALYYLTKSNLNNKNLLIAGTFMGFGMLSYFGYFTFYFVLIIFTYFKSDLNLKEKVTQLFYLGLPFSVMLIFIEIIAFTNGDSYILHNFYFAQSIVQGSPSEALIFVFKYFYQVEQIWGVILLSIFIFTIIKLLKKFKENFNDINNSINLLLLIGTITYLIYGLLAFFSGDFVYYGRLLHMYYPFIILGVVVFINQYKKVVVFMIVGGIINFCFSLNKLYKVDYPRSIIYSNNYFENENNNLTFLNETTCGFQFDKSNSRFLGKQYTPNNLEDLTLINFCFFMHFPDKDFIKSYNQINMGSNYNLISEHNHFMSFPAYTFEYCTSEGRDYFIENDFKIRVYQPNK